MKPYYEHGGITIYHGDCREVLPTLADGAVSAVVSDPPYFRVKAEAWDRQWRDAEAFLAWLGTVADEWRRVLAANGSLFCFASPDMGDGVADVIRARFQILNRIRWVKEQGWHQKAERATLRSFLSPWEEIIFAEQSGADATAGDLAGYDEAARRLHQRVYAPIGAVVRDKRVAAGLSRGEIDIACSPSRKPTGLCYRWEEGACLPTLEQFVDLCRACGDSRDYESLRRPFSIGERDEASDIWRVDAVMAFGGKHPCEKPLPLMERIIRASTRAGDVVLDTFAGSGATLEAARDLGRKAIGIEIEERYCEIAAKRLSQEVLFSEQPA